MSLPIVEVGCSRRNTTLCAVFPGAESLHPLPTHGRAHTGANRCYHWLARTFTLSVRHHIRQTDPEIMPNPTRDRPPPVPSRQRSRVLNTPGTLPTDARGAWSRLFRDLCDVLAQHVGGADRMSEPERMTIRRAAALECELVHLEGKFAEARAEGHAPDAADVDLYSRITNTQRRVLDSLGMQSRPRDITPDLRDYLRGDA